MTGGEGEKVVRPRPSHGRTVGGRGDSHSDHASQQMSMYPDEDDDDDDDDNVS